MNYLASALTARPQSAKSQESLQSTHSVLLNDAVQDARSLHEATTPEDCGSMLDNVSRPQMRRHGTSVRTKTTLQFCQPPPVTKRKQRLHIRPKVLLQLHRTSQEARPMPTFDVLSSVAFAPKLAKKFPNTFHGKASLGVNDLVLVASEDFSTVDAETDEADDLFEHDSWNSREIVAAISQHSIRQGSRSAEICLREGRTWTGTSLAKGGYEFVAIDDHGLRTIARWMPRRLSRKQPSDHVTPPIAAPVEEKAFNFSLIDPNSRRHAIIAMLDAHSLEISDRYSIPARVSAVREPSTEIALPPNTPDRGFVEVDETLKTLIIATGIWVAFCEGFSPSLSYDSPTVELPKPTSVVSTHKRRSLSLSIKDFRKQSPTPALDTTSRDLPSAQRPVSTPNALISPANIPLLSPPFLTPPRRTQSSGSAVMQRITSRRTSAKGSNDDGTSLAPRERSSAKTGEDLASSYIPEMKETFWSGTEKRKRPKGIKSLCCSFKKASNDSSP